MKKRRQLEAEIKKIDDSLACIGGTDDYPWAVDRDERCRAFVLDRLSTVDCDAVTLVRACDKLYRWIKTGETEEKPEPKPALAVIKKEEGTIA